MEFRIFSPQHYPVLFQYLKYRNVSALWQWGHCLAAVQSSKDSSGLVIRSNIEGQPLLYVRKGENETFLYADFDFADELLSSSVKAYYWNSTTRSFEDQELTLELMAPEGGGFGSANLILRTSHNQIELFMDAFEFYKWATWNGELPQ